jgi:hypothetical protein
MALRRPVCTESAYDNPRASVIASQRARLAVQCGRYEVRRSVARESAESPMRGRPEYTGSATFEEAGASATSPDS